MARATNRATRSQTSPTKGGAKKAASPKAPAKKAAPKKAAPKKAAAKKAPVKKAPAKKAPAKKAAPKKAAAKKAPAKKAPAKKAPAKKAPAKAGRSRKATFDKKFLDQQRAQLLAERARYLASADSLEAEADALVESREPGDVQFDEESGEGDTLAVERERDLALSAHARAAVDQIDAALRRIDTGAYGICQVSGLPIPKERLRAIPWAAERVEYKAGGLGRR